MPTFFKKRNKSYGVISKDPNGPVSTVRPLSAAFGSPNIGDIGDEDPGEKPRTRDRGKSRKSHNHTRSTSVPARPKSATFGKYTFKPESVDVPTLSKVKLKGLNSFDSENYATKYTDPDINVNGIPFTSESETRGRSHAPKLTVIRYTDKTLNSTNLGDLWTPTDNGAALNHYGNIYGRGHYGNNLNTEEREHLKGASSEEEISSPFPREPSIRVNVNNYHNQRKFSTFAGPNSFHDIDNTQQKENFINFVNQTSSDTKPHHSVSHDNESSPYASVDIVRKREKPPPPKRATSLLFEEVPIPTALYQSPTTFLPQSHAKQTSFEGSIVHITHESSKKDTLTNNGAETNALNDNEKLNDPYLSDPDDEHDHEDDFSNSRRRGCDSTTDKSSVPRDTRNTSEAFVPNVDKDNVHGSSSLNISCDTEQTKNLYIDTNTETSAYVHDEGVFDEGVNNIENNSKSLDHWDIQCSSVSPNFSAALEQIVGKQPQNFEFPPSTESVEVTSENTRSNYVTEDNIDGEDHDSNSVDGYQNLQEEIEQAEQLNSQNNSDYLLHHGDKGEPAEDGVVNGYQNDCIDEVKATLNSDCIENSHSDSSYFRSSGITQQSAEDEHKSLHNSTDDKVIPPERNSDRVLSGSSGKMSVAALVNSMNKTGDRSDKNRPNFANTGANIVCVKDHSNNQIRNTDVNTLMNKHSDSDNKENLSDQEAKNNSLMTENIAKRPVIPLKPATLIKTLISPKPKEDSVSKNPLLPKPYLSKPQKFVPGALNNKKAGDESESVNNMANSYIEISGLKQPGNTINQVSTKISDAKLFVDKNEPGSNKGSQSISVSDGKNVPTNSGVLKNQNASSPGEGKPKIDSSDFLDSLKRKKPARSPGFSPPSSVDPKEEQIKSDLGSSQDKGIEISSKKGDTDKTVDVMSFLDGLKHNRDNVRTRSFRKCVSEDHGQTDVHSEPNLNASAGDKLRSKPKKFGQLDVEIPKTKSVDIDTSETCSVKSHRSSVSSASQRVLFEQACKLPETAIDNDKSGEKCGSTIYANSIDPQKSSDRTNIETKISPILANKNAAGVSDKPLFNSKQLNCNDSRPKSMDNNQVSLPVHAAGNIEISNKTVHTSMTHDNGVFSPFQKSDGKNVNYPNTDTGIIKPTRINSDNSPINRDVNVSLNSNSNDSITVDSEYLSRLHGSLKKTHKDDLNRPTPPPRKNKGKRKSVNLNGSLNGSDRSSVSENSSNKELEMISNNVATFAPVTDTLYVDNQDHELVMPWDSHPWDVNSKSGNQFNTEDIPEPVLDTNVLDTENSTFSNSYYRKGTGFSIDTGILGENSVTPPESFLEDRKNNGYLEDKAKAANNMGNAQTNNGPVNGNENRITKSENEDEKSEDNAGYKFERHMKTIRSPLATHERAIDVETGNSSGSSGYSERAIDIQYLDTCGKPLAIPRNYEERGIDVGDKRELIVSKPHANKPKRKTSKLSDTSSRYTDVSKDTNVTVGNSSQQSSSAPQQSPLSSISKRKDSFKSPTKTTLQKQAQKDGKTVDNDLSKMNLPGLRLTPGGNGVLKGSEHLHPALERSLTSQSSPQQGEWGTKGGKLPIAPDLLVLVEEDYMTPRPGCMEIQNAKEVPESWSLEMLSNWKQLNSTKSTDETVGSGFHRHGSIMTDRSDRWATVVVERWLNEDVVDWAEIMNFDPLADVVAGTGITGVELLNLREINLVDLGIDDSELRYRILEEITRLREKPKSSVPFLSLKQASVRRKNLEASSNALKNTLSNLQQLNDKQEHQIESYLAELKAQQKEAETLLRRETNSERSTTHNSQLKSTSNSVVSLSAVNLATDKTSTNPGNSSQTTKRSPVATTPLNSWDNSEVLKWLSQVGLEKLSDCFKQNKVTGHDLCEISIQFLDKLGIEGMDESEQLLSRLYDLQSQGHMTSEDVFKFSVKSDPDTMSEVSFQSPPNPAKSRYNDITSPVSIATKHSSPWIPNKDPKLMSPLGSDYMKELSRKVLIWHQLGGTTTSSYVSLTPESTCYDVIHRLLNMQKVTDDANLFYLVDKDVSGSEQEVLQSQIMGDLTHRWANPVAHKLELKQSSGVQIKVTYKPANQKEAIKTKPIRIATNSAYNQVLLTACRKFKVINGSHFVLMEVLLDSSSVRPIQLTKNISELLSDHFLLCPKSERDQAQKIVKSLFSRRQSTHSHSSSNISDATSQMTLTSSQQGFEPQQLDTESYIVESEFDDNLSVATADNQSKSSSSEDNPQKNNLRSETLYDWSNSNGHMTEIHMPPNNQSYSRKKSNDARTSHSKASFVESKVSVDPTRSLNGLDDRKTRTGMPRRVRSVDHSLEHIGSDSEAFIELLQEIALLKESLKERDQRIQELQQDIERIQNQYKEVMFDQNRLRNLERIYEESKSQWKAEEFRLTQIIEDMRLDRLDKDPDAKVKFLEDEVEQSAGAISQQEMVLNELKMEIEGHASAENPPAKLVDFLQTQLTHGQNTHLALTQHHAQLLEQLNIAQQVLADKQTENILDLFSLVGSDKSLSLKALELEPKEGSYGLIIGRDKEKRLMVRHTEKGRPILKGDRLIEVNGRMVAKLEDHEIASFLKKAKEQSSSLKLVVLRENEPITSSVTIEDHESLKEDLSLALMEMESLQQDNTDASREIQELKSEVSRLNKEKVNLEKQLHLSRTKVQAPTPLLENGEFEDAPPHRRLQLMLDTLNAGKPEHEAVTSSELRRGASRRGLDWFNTLVSVNRLDKVLAYDEFDDKMPLYESMKIAPKSDILQALKDTILETRQQKTYLDTLMGLVIDNAPHLLKSVDSRLGLDDDLLSIKSRTEERC